MIVKNIHRKDWRRILSFSACFLLAVSVSCKKTPAKFGTDGLSPEDLLASGGVDTFSLNTFTVTEDSIPTDNQLHALCGSMHDPKMGIVNAAFNTQFEFPGQITHDPGSVPIIDSVVFSLQYVDYYGKLDAQTFQVFQLTDLLDVEETYYKFTTTSHQLTDLVLPSSATQVPNLEDSVVIAPGDIVGPQLRLHLDNAWGQNMVNEAINGTAFENTTDFQNFFNGFKVQVQETNPAAGSGGIIYFDLNSNKSGVTFYYKIQGDATPYSFNIVVGSDCADYNEVDVDNTGYHVADVISNPSSGQSQFYAQAFESRAVVEFPSINSLPKNCIIHQALLVLPVAYQTSNPYYPSTGLNVLIETDNYAAVGTTSYQGASKRYVIDIKNYVQSIVNGESENKGIFLNPYYFGASAERIIFNGAGSSYKSKPKLIIKYTQF